MDINPFIEDLSIRIASDAEVDAWCQDTYGRSVKVYLNYDVRQPPAADDCPCVMAYPSEKEYGGSVYNDAVELVCMVHDEEAGTVSGYGNIVAFKGVSRVEAFRKLILRVVSCAVEGTEAGQIDSISVDYDSISQFPFVVAAMAVSISDPWRIGSGNPAENE